MKPNHYEILGVDENATTLEIKTAWKNAARRYHPDSQSGEGSQSTFIEITKAWKELEKPENRKRYDQQRLAEASRRTRPESTHPAYRQQTSQQQRRQSETRTHKPSLKAHASVLLTEVYAGSTVVIINVEGLVECTGCSGVGDVLVVVDCPTCRGRGIRTILEHMPFSCARCNGEGKIGQSRTCTSCGGAGSGLVRESSRIRIPVGIRNGQVVHASLKSGNIVDITIEFVKMTPWRFERGLLCTDRRCSVKRLARGTTSVVSLPDGRKLQVKIPAGTEFGTFMKIADAGMPTENGSRQPALIKIVKT